MKILNISLALTMCLVLCASCSNDNEEELISEVKVEKTFGISNSPSVSRASIVGLTTAQPGFKWEDGDQITVFAQGHETGDPFDYTGKDGEYDHHGAFKGKTYEADKYVMLYPAQSQARSTDAGVTFNIPTQQKATPNSFDPSACIQIGTGTGKTRIGLLNVCAFFYVTLGPNCHQFKITALDENWHLSGTCTAKVNSAGDRIEEFSDATSNVVELVDIPAEGGTFVVAFIPSTSTGTKIKVSYNYTKGTMNQELEAGSNFLAGHLYNLGEIK